MTRALPSIDASRPVDYGSLYADYWARPDRWGKHSFADPEPLAEQILTTCGGGRILDVGCGMGLLARTLLRKGVDARGVDVAPAPVEEANRLAPGRFQVASILDLPFDDGSFDTVVSTDCLEHIREEDVPRALAELARVTRHGAFVRLAVTPDRDRTWHLTIRDRAWWEGAFFRAGFARHPLGAKVVPFEALDDEGWQVTLVLLKHTGAPGADYLTSPGREADAAFARAARAATFIRPGDVVLDAAPGAGAGPIVAALSTSAERVIAHAGAAAEACEERAARYALPIEWRSTPGSPAEFDLSGVGPSSVGCLLALEGLDAIRDPRRAADEILRVLVPGGRAILAAPAGESDRWREALDGLIEERRFAQSLGAEAPNPRARALKPLEAGAPAEGDWWLAVLCRDVVGASREGYVERSFPDYSSNPAFHVGNYARDHDNPWLLRAMISMGMRSPNRSLIAHTARRVLDHARSGSPDEGAALCVLAYRLLERDAMDPAEAEPMLARLDRFVAECDPSPHGRRWRISNQYARASLLMALGRAPEAREAFDACAGMDVLEFSPLLASKTIDARFLSGLISAAGGDHARAREAWRLGLEELRRVLAGDWTNIWGSPARPMPFGLPDVGLMVDVASRCAFGLLWLDEWHRRPGLAWSWTLKQTVGDYRRWIARLEETRDWLDRERGRFRRLAHEREAAGETLRARLEQSHQSAQAQRADFEARAAALREKLEASFAARKELDQALRDAQEAQRRRTTESQESRAALEARITELRDRLDVSFEARKAGDALLDESRTNAARLREALQAQREAAAHQAESVREAFARQAESTREASARQVESAREAARQALARRDELRGMLDASAERRARAEARAAALVQTIEELRAHIAELVRAREWQAGQARERAAAMEAAQGRLAEARAREAELRAWATKQHATIAAQVERRQGLETRIAALVRALDAAREAHAESERRGETARARMERDLGTLRQWAADLLRAKESLARQVERQQARLAQQAATIAEERARAKNLEAEVVRLRAEAPAPKPSRTRRSRASRGAPPEGNTGR
ncbi:MAG: methyltransferase domain-containing protein [Phycisphaerales bacterium]|nr:methyltransferase domain-containing protein [Phycisphaerales bacterium]